MNYYNKFLPGKTTVCAPLQKLLEQGCPWNWTAECNQKFKQLNEMATRAPILAHYNPKKPLISAVDASPYGLGAVISHMIGKDEEPIAFALCSLTASERNCSQIEKEGLAILFGLANLTLDWWYSTGYILA